MHGEHSEQSIIAMLICPVAELERMTSKSVATCLTLSLKSVRPEVRRTTDFDGGA